MKRRAWIKPRREEPRRGPERDPDYLERVRELPCYVGTIALKNETDRIHAIADPEERADAWAEFMRTSSKWGCQGAIEADHEGYRGVGQKCSDLETVPMCSRHHRQRTDYSGVFFGFDSERMRAWCDEGITWTQGALLLDDGAPRIVRGVIS